MTFRQRPLRALADVRLGRQRSPQNAEGPHLVPYLRAANIKDGQLVLDDVKSMNFTPDEQAVFQLRSGDILVTEGSGSLASVGASAVWDGSIDGPLCFQNTLIRLRPRPGVSEGFVGWWARSAFGSGQFAAISSGANIFHLGAEAVRSLPVPVPPVEEQRRIADFLDVETARIDALITAKQKMIDLQDERLHAAMYRAFANGLRNDPTKPSGLDWLASVPRSWGCAPVSAHFTVQLGKMLNQEASEGDEQRPYLRNTNVQWDRLDTSDMASMSFDEGDRANYALRAGDLLVCEGGEVGRAAPWDPTLGECYFQKAIHRVRPIGTANSRFLLYCLWVASDLNVFRIEGNQSTIVHLTAEKLRVHRFPWPPPDVQNEIVAALDRARAAQANFASTLTRQVELLRERRQALITAAVTGELSL